jgi:hypothetical protein
VKRLLLREAQVRPLLVVFEDMHWIDGETQALLDSLVESLGSARLLLLVNYHPEFEHRWGSKTAYSQLRLESLPAERGGAALCPPRSGARDGAARADADEAWQPALSGGDSSDAGGDGGPGGGAGGLSADAIGRSAAGADHGADDPSIADRSIAGRVETAAADNLGHWQRRALRASRANRGATGGGVAAGARASADGGISLRDGALSGSRVLFQAFLTHEVTYNGMLQEWRRTLHARIAHAIETLHRDRLGEQIERLADHAVRGELGDKAAQYLRLAGLKAAARSALSDARTWFEQALGVLEALPESPLTLERAFDIRLELRPVLSRLAEIRQMLNRLREAEILAKPGELVPGRARAGGCPCYPQPRRAARRDLRVCGIDYSGTAVG